MKEQTNQFLIQLDEAQYKTPDISKKGSFIAANNIYNSIMEGHSSAIQVAEMFKFVEETSKQLKEISDSKGKNTFVDLVREEIISNSDNGKSVTTKYGNKFELMEAGSKFYFDACGDPIWVELNTRLERLKNQLKERESFLKGLSGATTLNITNPETGEVHENVTLYPPIKSSTSTYKQTIING
jgi:hypothetical protein